MSDGEVLVSEGGESKNGQDLIDQLPPWMPKDESTGNFKLFDVVGRAVDRLDGDLADLDNATTVQHAETVAQLERLAKLVSLPPKDGESKEKYRARTIAEFQTLTSEGTAEDIINNSATVLDTSSSNIAYSKLDENGVVNLGVPADAINESALTGQEFKNIITKQAAAGFRIEATLRGTYTYLPESAYSGPYDSANGGYDSTALDSDPDKGHTSDSDGDGVPDDGGGTYAGLI